MLKTSPAIIWITPKCPLPDHDGARRATTALLRNIGFVNAIIHVVVLSKENQELSALCMAELPIASIHFLERKTSRLRQILCKILRPLLPLTFQTYFSKKLRNALDTQFASIKPNQIVCDGLHAMAAVNPKWYPLITYRAHNVEHEIWQRWSANRSFPYSILGLIESFLVQRFEKLALREAKTVIAISQRDATIIEQLSERSCEAIGPGFPFHDQMALTDASDLRLLWVGKFDWKPNREGLEWFLTNVWPYVQRRCTLTIIGSGTPPQIVDPNVIVASNVPNLEHHYTESHLCLVPIYYGSGTRLKAIEAANFGRACLGTTIGLEGLPLYDGISGLIANDADAWILALNSMTIAKCRSLGLAAFQALSEDWNERNLADKFVALLA